MTLPSEMENSGDSRLSVAAPRTVCLDLDGTLCTNTFGDYEDAEPLPWAIARANALAAAGHRIVIFTARGTATGIDWADLTRSQLDRWGVRYDDLRFGKPSADVYVDDRAVHTDSWRAGDAFAPPGLTAGEQVPPAAPAHLTSIVEDGRTFATVPVALAAHAERASARARAAGIVPVPSAGEIAAHVRAALARTEGEVVFSIAVTAGGHAAQLDAGVSATTVAVSCRPLSVVSNGIPAGGSTAGAPGRWPLWRDERGRLLDTLGGTLATVRDGRLELDLGAPTVAADWAERLARALGIQTVDRPVEDIEEADEAMVIGMPFCVVPLGSVDGHQLPAGAPGPVAERLLAAWRDEVGVDLRPPRLELAANG